MPESVVYLGFVDILSVRSTTSFVVNISAPSTVDNLIVANPVSQLTGSTVSASFKLTGLNNNAGQRTIDWTVREGTGTVLLTATTVCTGLQGTVTSSSNETCTSSNPALSLLVENPSSAKLSLAFPGKADGQYQVSAKASYGVNTALFPPRTVASTRTFPSGYINVEDVVPVAQMTTSVALIALNQVVEFDTTGSVYPKGAKVYFSAIAPGNNTPIKLTPNLIGEGEVVTKPRFSFTTKYDTINMTIVSVDPTTNGPKYTNKQIDLKNLFTTLSGGSSGS